MDCCPLDWYYGHCHFFACSHIRSSMVYDSNKMSFLRCKSTATPQVQGTTPSKELAYAHIGVEIESPREDGDHYQLSPSVECMNSKVDMALQSCCLKDLLSITQCHFKHLVHRAR
eukprot:Gb_28440 [translate_table: standard]